MIIGSAAVAILISSFFFLLNCYNSFSMSIPLVVETSAAQTGSFRAGARSKGGK